MIFLDNSSKNPNKPSSKIVNLHSKTNELVCFSAQMAKPTFLKVKTKIILNKITNLLIPHHHHSKNNNSTNSISPIIFIKINNKNKMRRFKENARSRDRKNMSFKTGGNIKAKLIKLIKSKYYT